MIGKTEGRAVLLIAFHFPPLGESSGLQRTLSLANDLAERGWRPVVLTVTRRTYRATRDDQLVDIDSRVKVYRAFAFDASRDLAIAGKYSRLLALPDVWSSWLAVGFLTAIWVVLKYRPAFVWSTYPIATAHLLGLLVARATRRPWIADFRDSMTEAEYPADRTQRRVYRWIEKQVAAQAHRCVFTTPGALAMYSRRYPKNAAAFRVIPNGYDERYFRDLDTERMQKRKLGMPATLLHSGVVYPSERDPRHLFEALRRLKLGGVGGERLKIVLRASGFDRTFRPQIDALEIGDMVVLEPAIGYRDALLEMTEVDGLLVLQASNCNHQIPAKLYEYIRSGTPIVALTDLQGDTAQVLVNLQRQHIAPLDDVDAIHDLLVRFVQQAESGDCIRGSIEDARQFSRKNHAVALEQFANELG